MEYEIKEQYRIWLASIKGITPKKYRILLDSLGDADVVWDSPDRAKELVDEKTLKEIKKMRSQEEFVKLFYKLEKSGILAISSSHPDYPESLLDLFDPPPVLYIRGNVEILKEERMLAVVGTRTPTYDGKKTASEFVSAIAKEDVVIVSGLARGIDTIAHEACIQSGTRTIAVLGSGLNSMYPPENAELAENIIETGGAVISEMLPDEGPHITKLFPGLKINVILVPFDIFELKQPLIGINGLHFRSRRQNPPLLDIQGRNIFCFAPQCVAGIDLGIQRLLKNLGNRNGPADLAGCLKILFRTGGLRRTAAQHSKH